MENAVIYARYSSHNQTEQSIEGQLAAAYKYASQKEYNVIEEYCDRAKTGTNDNREAFQRMLRDSSKKAFSVIIVWKVDRFGRNREEIAINKHKVKKNGVRVEYVAENITDGPEGVILESVLEGMAEYYSLQLSQNVRRGQLEAAKKHHVIGGNIAYGYMTGPDKTYVINPETGPVLQEIFRRYADGETMSEITEWLNNSGYRNHRGQPFKKNFLPGVLHNEIYIGVYKFKNIIRDEDAVPALVSKETFERVQKMLDCNRRMPSHRWSYSDYRLTGKLYCACGAPMVGDSGHSHSGGKYLYYVCGSRKKHGTCSMKRIPKLVVENIIYQEVMAIFQKERYFHRVVKGVTSYLNEVKYGKLESKTHTEGMIKNVEDAITNLITAVEHGMPYEAVRTRLEELQERKSELTRRASQEVIYRQASPDMVRTFMEAFLRLDWANLETQKRVLELLLNKVVIENDRMTIALNYSSDHSEVPTVRICGLKQVSTDNIRIIDNTFVIVKSLPQKRSPRSPSSEES